ncbi:MAG: prolyl oligopeptidase family serine peptidase [Anaerolineaceae bacterium]|nr:prolyl oligopeptidase family serine peptidase [Anaerolineaceae bacterium]MCB9102062.1 prolyl oligopeptidase family serine peptidase [Anaerolineales bacterium]
MNIYEKGHYWLRLFLLFIVTLTLSLIMIPILLGGLFTLGLIYAPCTDNAHTPATYGLTGWEDVTLPAQAGGEFRGYFIPGANGATIIIPPTGSAGQDGRLAEAAILARHGYAVLLFESRRCAGMGPLTLGYAEVSEVADVVDYLTTRREVDPERLGVYGFSTAGATAIMATAQLPGLHAVVAEGGYGDFLENALVQEPGHSVTAYFLRLYIWGSRWAYGWGTRLELEQLSPVTVIPRIAPRPILLIYGSREVSLPGGVKQQAAAGPNATLWVVDGASHGEYRVVAPEAYEVRVVGFFDRSLALED